MIKKMVVASALSLLCASVAGAQEMLVGVELPLSGSFARAGASTLEGIKSAAEIFNKQNPKYPVKLAIVDDESAPGKAISAVEKLASQGAMGMTGCYTSAICGSAAMTANKLGIAMISAGAPGSEIVNRGMKTFFRINNGEGYTKAIVAMISEMQPKSVAILTTTMQATHEVSKEVGKQLAAKGVKITFHAFEAGMSDYKPLISKIKIVDRPDILFMAGLENEYIGILRAAKVLKPNLKAVVGFWSLATSKLATEYPDLTNNVFGTAMVPFPVEFKGAEGKEFEKTFNRLYKKDPDYLNEYGYVESMILFEAMKRAAAKGTLTKEEVVKEMRKTDRSTPMGRVTFDSKGDNPNFTQWYGQFQNGKILIVWPSEHSNGKMRYPAVPW